MQTTYETTQYLKSLEELLDLAPYLIDHRDINQLGLDKFTIRVRLLRESLKTDSVEEVYTNEKLS